MSLWPCARGFARSIRSRLCDVHVPGVGSRDGLKPGDRGFQDRLSQGIPTGR